MLYLASIGPLVGQDSIVYHDDWSIATLSMGRLAVVVPEFGSAEPCLSGNFQGSRSQSGARVETKPLPNLPLSVQLHPLSRILKALQAWKQIIILSTVS